MDGESENGEDEVGEVDGDLSVGHPIYRSFGHQSIVTDDRYDVKDFHANQRQAHEAQSHKHPFPSHHS